MTRTGTRRAVRWAAPLLTLAILAGCGGGGDDAGKDTKGSETTAAGADSKAQSGDVEVEIKGFKFTPPDLVLKAGSKVTWTNADSATHTATGTDGPAEFDSGNMKKGDSFSFTFDEPGTYEYHCEIHSTMKATITVQ